MSTAPTDIADRMQQLISQRQHHVDALGEIDATLQQVQSALSGIGAVNGALRRRGPGRPRRVAAQWMPTTPRSGRRRGRRRRRKFAVSGEQMILTMAGQRGGATTAEIKERWKAEGRGGTADNALSKMARAGKLKRTRLLGRRGSRFMAA